MEILIALFIFMLGILGVMSMFPVAMHTAGMAMGETRGAALARSALAQITADCRAAYYRGLVGAVNTDDTLTAQGTPNWNADQWRGYFVTIVGDGAGGQAATQWQSRLIVRNTANTLTVCPDWNPRPDIGDDFIVTRLGLPALPRGEIAATNVPNAGETFLTVPNVSWDDDQWNGYTLLMLTGAAAGEQRLITDTRAPDTLDFASAWEAATLPVAGDRFAIINKQPRDGFIREIPNATGNIVRLGRADSAYDDVDPLQWSAENYQLLPVPVALPNNGTCTGGTANTLVGDTSAAAWRGRLVLITGDNPRSGQLRLVTDVDTLTNTLTVYPDWAEPPQNGDTFEIRSQLGYFLIIGSGRAAGRAFRIDGHQANAAGDELDCGNFAWFERGVRQARRRTGAASWEWKVRNASAFLIAGNRSWLGTVALRPTPDAANPGYVLKDLGYAFDTFGWPKTAEPQTGPDFSIQKEGGSSPARYSAEENSEYSVVCIFGDSGALPDGPVRVDVIVYRNLDSAKTLNENRQPVGFLTGYVGRP